MRTVTLFPAPEVRFDGGDGSTLQRVVINASMLWITSWISEDILHWGLFIEDFWWTASWAAIVLSILSWLLSLVVPDSPTPEKAHWDVCLNCLRSKRSPIICADTPSDGRSAGWTSRHCRYSRPSSRR